MTILKFPVNEIFKKIIIHSKARSVEHMPSFEERCDRQFVKDGVPVKDYYDDADLDLKKIPAGFWLVKDQGIYIMSNGIPRMPQGKNVVYAKGYGKDAEYQDIHEAVGGDDFVQALPISWMIRNVYKKEMILKFTKDSISLVE
jgi:hypothetical protein